MKIVITPGWQGRAAKLIKKVRACKHTGKRLLSQTDGVPFCAKCGLRFVRAMNDERKS